MPRKQSFAVARAGVLPTARVLLYKRGASLLEVQAAYAKSNCKLESSKYPLSPPCRRPRAVRCPGLDRSWKYGTCTKVYKSAGLLKSRSYTVLVYLFHARVPMRRSHAGPE